MATYKRYKKLQKFIFGQPVLPIEFKKGDLITTGEWDDLFNCEHDLQWVVVVGEYICQETTIPNQYKQYEKLQAFYPNGEEVKPSLFKIGKLLGIWETSEECEAGKAIYKWVKLDGYYICEPTGNIDEYDQYEKYQRYYITNDKPVHPEVFKKGNLIQTNVFPDIMDCKEAIEWILVPNEYICVNDEYNLIYNQYEKLQAYYKGGSVVTPYQYKKGRLLDTWETNEECEANHLIYKWVKIIDTYICEPTETVNEYKQFEKFQKYYIDTNEPVYPELFKKGKLIRTRVFDNLEQCETGREWILVPNEYICEFDEANSLYNQYEKYQEYYIDGGAVTPSKFKKGTLLHSWETSEECEAGKSIYKWVKVDGYFCELTDETNYVFSRYEKYQRYYIDSDRPIYPYVFKKGKLLTENCHLNECEGDLRITYEGTIHERRGEFIYDIYTKTESKNCGLDNTFIERVDLPITYAMPQKKIYNDNGFAALKTIITKYEDNILFRNGKNSKIYNMSYKYTDNILNLQISSIIQSDTFKFEFTSHDIYPEITYVDNFGILDFNPYWYYNLIPYVDEANNTIRWHIKNKTVIIDLTNSIVNVYDNKIDLTDYHFVVDLADGYYTVLKERRSNETIQCYDSNDNIVYSKVVKELLQSGIDDKWLTMSINLYDEVFQIEDRINNDIYVTKVNLHDLSVNRKLIEKVKQYERSDGKIIISECNLGEATTLTPSIQIIHDITGFDEKGFSLRYWYTEIRNEQTDDIILNGFSSNTKYIYNDVVFDDHFILEYYNYEDILTPSTDNMVLISDTKQTDDIMFADKQAYVEKIEHKLGHYFIYYKMKGEKNINIFNFKFTWNKIIYFGGDFCYFYEEPNDFFKHSPLLYFGAKCICYDKGYKINMWQNRLSILDLRGARKSLVQDLVFLISYENETFKVITDQDIFSFEYGGIIYGGDKDTSLMTNPYGVIEVYNNAKVKNFKEILPVSWEIIYK